MKSLDSPLKNAGYFFYRLVSPIIDPITFITGTTGYIRFIREVYIYKSMDPRAHISLKDLYPILNERISFTPFDGHYFFQGKWILNEIIKSKPTRHVDVGSKYELSGYISLLTKTEFVDLRPINAEVKNLTVVRGDILHLPYKDNSIPSLSSLHVLEHIGLGRYGDQINPEGTKMACKELVRVLKNGGYLYISLPIGKPRICFNAHRIHNPVEIQEFFKELTLRDFSVVDDKGRFQEHKDPADFLNQTYACGMYTFQKIK